MNNAFLSRRVLSIAPSPSIAANALVAQLRAEGRDIVNFTVGEPDLNTPAHIVEAARQAMESGDTHYTHTLGTPALRKAIVAKLARDNGLEYSIEEVVAASGGKQVIFEALAATLNPGDEVIVHAPYWVSYPDITRLNGGTPVVIQGHEDNGFIHDGCRSYFNTAMRPAYQDGSQQYHKCLPRNILGQMTEEVSPEQLDRVRPLSETAEGKPPEQTGTGETTEVSQSRTDQVTLVNIQLMLCEFRNGLPEGNDDEDDHENRDRGLQHNLPTRRQTHSTIV